VNGTVGKRSAKKIEGHQLAVLARDLMRCRGECVVPGASLYGSAAKVAQEVLGVPCSGGAKAFLRSHRDALRRWCRDNWIARSKSPKDRGAYASGGADVKTDDFLRTYEWRRVRMVALKKYGAKCQCCGATPATGAVMNVDHIKPRKLFPQLALDVDNLQVLCDECNHGKGNWDMTDWRAKQSPEVGVHSG
jgi:5-methylcytosine-specific restriction endonuclease McrA